MNLPNVCLWRLMAVVSASISASVETFKSFVKEGVLESATGEDLLKWGCYLGGIVRTEVLSGTEERQKEL